LPPELSAHFVNHCTNGNPAFDILIKNGMILDGSGKPEFPADIGIKYGKIIAIENHGIIDESSALNIIDAKD
jgi:N-acyl-D-amino-acid deacylase